MNPPTPPSTSQRGRFSSVLRDNRDMVLVFLNTHLNELLDNSDTALMEFAEQAQNEVMRGEFFHAMADLRQKRGEFESLFRKFIGAGFERFEAPFPTHGQADRESVTSLGEDALSLVSPDELEETVATDNLIARAKSRYYPQLYAIAQRLAVLNQGRRLTEVDIPAGPTQLVSSFQRALKPLLLDMRVKLVFYALFDKFVMRQLTDMYEEFNGNLKAAGILPNLKPLVTRSEGGTASRPRPPTPGAPPPAGGAAAQEAPAPTPGAPPPAAPSLGEELFGTVLTLLAQRRATSAPAGAARRDAQLAGPAGAVIRQQLIEVIDGIRPASVSQPGGVLTDLERFPNVVVDPGFLEKIRVAMHQEQERIFAQVGRDQMPGIDADTIDLIGMLFEYMLNDPLLPNLAKALLSHLHTPYLKLALIDRELLVDSEHPARLLLDQLVDAGGQWVFENDPKRGIFPHMQTVVNRVLKDFKNNVELFQELIDYLSAAMEDYRRKAEAIEQRARESIQGREKLRVAKQRANNEMKARASHAFLPGIAQQFLQQTWSDRLVLILLRHPEGESSEDWRCALQVADDLVWLFEPKTHAAELEDLARVSRLVRDEIQAGLEVLGGYPEPYVEKLRDLLRDPAALLDYAPEREAEEAMVPGTPALVAEIPEGAPPVPLVASAPASRQPLSSLTEELSVPPAGVPAATMRKLAFGTWFEFQTQGGGSPRRLKLSWSSPLTGTCMFVDRSGLQAEVKTETELSRMLALGLARIIPRPKHPFVERTLLAIRRVLEGSS